MSSTQKDCCGENSPESRRRSVSFSPLMGGFALFLVLSLAIPSGFCLNGRGFVLHALAAARTGESLQQRKTETGTGNLPSDNAHTGTEEGTVLSDEADFASSLFEDSLWTLDRAHLEVAAYDGDAKAACILGLRSEYGLETDNQDLAAALLWYALAAEGENTMAMVQLGYGCRSGVYPVAAYPHAGIRGSRLESFFSEDEVLLLERLSAEDSAFAWFLAAAAGGDPAGDAACAMRLTELSDSEGSSLARNFLDRSVEADCPSGILLNAVWLQEGLFSDAMPDAALDLYRSLQAWEPADPAEQEVLADAACRQGLLCVEEATKGVLTVARRNEITRSLKEVLPEGRLLKESEIDLLFQAVFGPGEDSDSLRESLLEEAQTAFLRASSMGNVSADFYMGQLYDLGLGVARDDEQALSWYLAAAESDYAPAQNQVGVFYFNGRAVEADPAEAAFWQKQAAAAGYGPAQLNLAYLYEKGWGVDQDAGTALAYYELARENGFEEAGDGVDRVRAALRGE